jgi:hypothetical protein
MPRLKPRPTRLLKAGRPRGQKSKAPAGRRRYENRRVRRAGKKVATEGSAKNPPKGMGFAQRILCRS